MRPKSNRIIDAEVGADKRLNLEPTFPAYDARVQALIDHVNEHGYVIIPNAFDQAEIAEAKAEILRLSQEQVAEEAKSMPAAKAGKGRNKFEGLNTQRLYALANKSRVFDKFALHPDVLVLNDHFLEPGYLLSSFQSINIQPGEKPQTLHYDDGYITVPRPHKPFGAAIMVAIDPYTTTNGATVMVPKSHSWGPEPIPHPSQAQPAIMSSGSMFYFLSTLWHGGGGNTSAQDRIALTVQYAQPWIRPLENQILAVEWDKLDQMPPRLVDMLGYKKWVFGQETDSESNVTLMVHHPQAWDRIYRGIDLGFAEAYMMQELDCDDLLGLLRIFVSNRDELGFSGSGSWVRSLVLNLVSFLFKSRNSVNSARLNASFHYDTSNDHFASFLSPDMNYSSAIWSSSLNESLEEAQRRKVNNIINKAGVKSSDHVLDIGCGWGNLAIEAVKQTGCRVTGLTLSVKQKELAERRIKDAGLENKIQIVLCDYRCAPRPESGYDCVVSVEMLEHVGDKYMNQYFESISSLLKNTGGRMVVQGITIINSANGNKTNAGEFLREYIFPGGYLATINQLLSSIHTGSKGALEVDNVQSIGPHYIQTLHSWHKNFLHNWDAVRKNFMAEHAGATEEELEAYRRRWVLSEHQEMPSWAWWSIDLGF
ncbi:Tuberculostearic acid methyltransferase UfaA1 [Paramyrothecium foliicola]|nr:Tuberculostearic acid methyltransferase UfaA1 [Paramyrothecium foliicola]